MINKQVETVQAAVGDIPDGASVMIGGFGEAGSPTELIHALIDHGAKDLTVINNNTGNGEVGLAALIGNGQVKKRAFFLDVGRREIYRDPALGRQEPGIRQCRENAVLALLYGVVRETDG